MVPMQVACAVAPFHLRSFELSKSTSHKHFASQLVVRCAVISCCADLSSVSCRTLTCLRRGLLHVL